MNTQTIDLATRLKLFGDEIAGWKEDAAALRLKADAAIFARTVDVEALTSLESTAEAIYAAIARFDALKGEIGAVSPRAAGQVAEVGEALRLVLLEITEIGTSMYAVKSEADADVIISGDVAG